MSVWPFHAPKWYALWQLCGSYMYINLWIYMGCSSYIYINLCIYGFEAATGPILFGCGVLVATERLRQLRAGVRRRCAMIRGWSSFPKADVSSANLLWILAESAPNFPNNVHYKTGSSPLSRSNSIWVKHRTQHPKTTLVCCLGQPLSTLLVHSMMTC